ncbi:MAG: TonB-dependent receptor [Tannerellaceae bacterium]
MNYILYRQFLPEIKHIFRIMKISVIVMFTCIYTLLAVESHSQNAKVSIQANGFSIQDVMKEIERQTDYLFVYNNNEVNVGNKVSLNVKNETVSAVLANIFKDTDVEYKVIGKNITLVKRNEITGRNFVNQQSAKKVSGTVVDQLGEPIAGANVVEKATTNGTITDIDGRFSFEVSEGATLLVSFIGYSPSETKIGSRTTLIIKLKEDSELLEEVVVIGYGTVKKSDLTGSVGSVSMAKVSQVGITSADRALQGQVAGVQVNAKTGQPGGNSLAGGNEPLYVIDGMPLVNMDSNLNPEDIISMEVLKDASSTAIYGSRGANGVVLITTKRGKSTKTVVNYSGYMGVSQLRKKLDLLEKDDYIAMVNEVSQNDGKGIAITPEEVALLPNNDWQDLAYQNALMHNHQLSVAGGNESTNLYASLNYLNQEGIILNSGYDRLSLRINGDHKINSKLSLSANIAYSYGKKRHANSDTGGWGGIAYTAMVMPPISEIKDEEGKYTVFKGDPWGGTNPVGMAELYKNKSVDSKLLANLSLNYNIIDGLIFKINAGAEVNANELDIYIPIGLAAGPGASNGNATKSKSNYYSLINENILTYEKKINKKHSINIMGGVTFQTYQTNHLKGTSTGFLRDIYETYNLGAGANPGKPASGFSDYKMVSFLGRANYNLMERYLFTVSARYDGSSKFSVNHKFAFFPSAAVAWRMTEEQFLKDVTWLSNLKFRASIGQTGNQGISPYGTQAILGTSTPVFDAGKDVGFGLSSIANDNLKWETTTQTDIGLDVGLFDNRLNIGVDYYLKQTRDLLYNAPLPPSSGYSKMLRNIGRIDNKGIEISINTINMKGKVNWSTNLNISANRSIVKDLGCDVQGAKIQRIDYPGGGGNWFPLFLGKAPGQLYGYEVEGIYQTDEEAIQNGEGRKRAGDYRYKDVDGKPGITTGDKVMLTNLQPKFTFGLTNVINWNNFEFTFLVIGSIGNDIVNEFNKNIVNIGGSWNIRKEVWENRWQPGKGGEYARASSSTKDYLAFGDPSSIWVENGSYVRFKDIKLSYTIPEKIFKGSFKPNILLYVSGQNLITITNYSHYDPEASWTASSINGWDRGVYPSSKSYTFGLQVKF